MLGVLITREASAGPSVLGEEHLDLEAEIPVRGIFRRDHITESLHLHVQGEAPDFQEEVFYLRMNGLLKYLMMVFIN